MALLPYSASDGMELGYFEAGAYFSHLSYDMGDTLCCRGINKDNVEGTSTAPSMRLDNACEFKFRWGVTAGGHTITISTKQSNNISSASMASMTIMKNPSIGIVDDVVGYATSGSGWQTIGPLTINPTSDGVVWVKLENNEVAYFGNPCYFDNIVAT